MLSRAASVQETHHIRTVRFQTDEAATSHLKGVNLSLDMWVVWGTATSAKQRQLKIETMQLLKNILDSHLI